MAAHQDTGRRGEELAQAFLERKGLKILEANWRYRRAEVDLIAMDGGILTIVEVKTRSSDVFGRPEVFVTRRKVKLLVSAAIAYMTEIDHNWEIRFDIVSVLLRRNGDYRIEHFEDAFFPGLA